MPKVRVFSTPSCPYCVTLKEFLKEHQVEFESVNVAEDAQAREEMIKKTGQMEAPIVEIDGEVIIGFNKKKICQLLNIKD